MNAGWGVHEDSGKMSHSITLSPLMDWHIRADSGMLGDSKFPILLLPPPRHGRACQRRFRSAWWLAKWPCCVINLFYIRAFSSCTAFWLSIGATFRFCETKNLRIEIQIHSALQKLHAEKYTSVRQWREMGFELWSSLCLIEMRTQNVCCGNQYVV